MKLSKSKKLFKKVIKKYLLDVKLLVEVIYFLIKTIRLYLIVGDINNSSLT